tara:strand:+ start:19117 stop:20283 length:1167 start_codon:yes stop_codon:yes gene_type:complete
MFQTIKIFIKRVFLKIIRELITLSTKQVKNRIIFMQESKCGSNSYALWKYSSKKVQNKYELILHENVGDDSLDFFSYVKKHRELSSCKLIITTHASYKPSKNHINFQLWHGCSTKKSGIMEFKEKQGFEILWKKVDYIMSYSETYTTYLNAQMLSSPWKYIITGAPRNDFLFKSDGISNLIKIFGHDIKEKKIIFFLPTYRNYYGQNLGNKNIKNIFGFENFSVQEFDNFLDLNQTKIIYKPHPHEEETLLRHFDNRPLNNVLILKNNDLKLNKIDLYEIVNASDIMITDYSSIFYDYLLLDKPIIFTPVDLLEYKKSRGFLVESFEIWAPGPLVYDQNNLQNEIKKSLNDKSYFKEKRDWMTNHHHRYKDGESSNRLWKFIDKIIDK